MLNSRDKEDTVRKGKEIIERIKNKHMENIRKKLKSPKPIYDDIYFKALEYLDEEDLSGEFSGKLLWALPLVIEVIPSYNQRGV